MTRVGRVDIDLAPSRAKARAWRKDTFDASFMPALHLSWRLAAGSWWPARMIADPNPFPRIRLWSLRR